MRFYPQAASSAFAVCGFFTVNTLPDFTLTRLQLAIVISDSQLQLNLIKSLRLDKSTNRRRIV